MVYILLGGKLLWFLEQAFFLKLCSLKMENEDLFARFSQSSLNQLR